MHIKQKAKYLDKLKATKLILPLKVLEIIPKYIFINTLSTSFLKEVESPFASHLIPVSPLFNSWHFLRDLLRQVSLLNLSSSFPPSCHLSALAIQNARVSLHINKQSQCCPNVLLSLSSVINISAKFYHLHFLALHFHLSPQKSV